MKQVLTIAFGAMSADIVIDDPDMPADELATLLIGAADAIMGRSDRRFAAILAQAKELSLPVNG